MRDFIAQIGGSLLRIALSRKFLAFAVVTASAWYGLDQCLTSENPMAFALFGVFAGIIGTAVTVFSLANSRVHIAREQCKGKNGS